MPENEKKYYLSLNTRDNVFKCWYCREGGGVLQFEALLSDQSYETVRQKYFGKRKKNLHPAYNLSPDQLQEIGWQDKKRLHFELFQEQKNEVIKDWKTYEYEELMIHYALVTLITHFPIEAERKKHFGWFVEICKQSKVNNLAKKIMQQWNSTKKENWSVQGKEMARIAYDTIYQSGDFEFQNLFVIILFIHKMSKLESLVNRDQIAISNLKNNHFA
ncbi:hypothetical protein WMZ97_16480 [Lentibacillus sp. N15]|uniref:hypothetical protein n=1 Tax=Lentibacillus songyuanensis TaxID=3136161 RepID=UPI0031BA406A